MRNEMKNNLPEAVEAIVRAIYRENRCPGISFRDASISLKDNYFRPYLIVYLIPFIQNLLYVILYGEPMRMLISETRYVSYICATKKYLICTGHNF